MGLNVARGFLNTTTAAAGNTVVVSSLGFQPKVVFFWWNGRVDTTDAVGRRTQQTGFGYACTTTDRRYATCLSQDTPTNMVTNSMQGNAACIGITTTADAIDGLMDLQSMDSGGFTLVIDNAFVASYTVHYLALGGDNIVNVGGNNFTKAAATGNQDVEQVSFLPNFLFMFSTGQTTINDTVAIDAQLALGAAKSSSNRYCYVGGSNDGAGNAQTMSYAFDGECFALFDAAITATAQRADFVNFHSSPANGFRVNWLEGTAQPVISYVAIEFTSANYVVLGDLLTQTDTTTDIVESGMPFQPLGGMFISHCKAKNTQDTATDDFGWSVGAFTSTSARSAAGMMDDDAAATAVVGTAVEFDEVYVNLPNTAATVEGLMDIKSVDATGFTCIMDDADPAQAFVWYMVFGPENQTVNATAGTIASAGRTGTVVPGAVTVQASAGLLDSNGHAGTVSVSSNQTVQAAAGVLDSTGHAGTVVPGAVTVQAVAAVLDSTGHTGTVTPGAVTVQASAGLLDSNGHSGSVIAGGVTITASAGLLNSSGHAGAVVPGAVTITANAGVLDSTGHAGTVSASGGEQTITATAGVLASAGHAGMVQSSVSIQANAGLLDSAGHGGSVIPGGVTVTANVGIIDIAGHAGTISAAGGDLIVDSDDIYHVIGREAAYHTGQRAHTFQPPAREWKAQDT